MHRDRLMRVENELAARPLGAMGDPYSERPIAWAYAPHPIVGGHDEIISWTIAFGDGSVASTSSANHTYAAPGTYEVTLTVEDASGASTTSTCVITIEASSPPVVTWTTPEADLAAAPGTWLTFAVTVEVAPGRSVVGVEFSVGGTKQGEMDTEPPYSLDLQVPASGPGLEVTATALDALGESGTSSPRIVTPTL